MGSRALNRQWATDWILHIKTPNSASNAIHFRKTKDILLRLSSTYGNPPEFPSF